MTRTLTLLAALTLAGCACGEPGRCQLAPPPGQYQSYTPRPVYAVPPVCPGGAYGGYLAAQGRCSAQQYHAPEQQLHQTYCMPLGGGAFSCSGS